ncbi:MAG: STAS domain-containing protein [Muribaculaceae bacterium]|nr:STAS domain-containing protein [Muribaculaceae bacterium]
MKTIIQEGDGHVLVTLDGELDTASAAVTEQELQPVMMRDNCDAVLDCSRLLYISSSGLRLLLALNKRYRQYGHRVKVKGLSDDLLKVFKMTGFDHLFDIEP